MLILRPDFYLLYCKVRGPVWKRPPGLTWKPGSPRDWGHALMWVAFEKHEASKPLSHFQSALNFQKFKLHWFTARLELLNAFIVCADDTWPPKTHTYVRFSFTATTSPLSLAVWFHVETLPLVLLNQVSEDEDLAVNSGKWRVQCPVDRAAQEN